MIAVKSFFVDNSTQVWTFLSVVLGGLVTYASTSAAERRKNKLQMQREKLGQVMIPYCTCLEKAIESLNNGYDEEYSIYFPRIDENGEELSPYDAWCIDIAVPLKFLNAAKRVFLSKKSRGYLKQYEDTYNDFVSNVEEECHLCIAQYIKYLENVIIDFPNIEKAMFVGVSLEKKAIGTVKYAIIKKAEVSLVNDISSISFTYNDDPDNNRVLIVDIKKDIRRAWSAINYGAIEANDIADPNEKLAYLIFDYVSENAADEKEVLTNIIAKTKSTALLTELHEMLERMRNTLTKEIDRIAR